MIKDILDQTMSIGSRTLNAREYDATIAACALIAAANDNISEAQRAAAIKAIQGSPNMKNVDARTISDDFRSACGQIDADKISGEANLLRKLAKIRDQSVARTILRYAIGMANADDGKIDASEKTMLTTIGVELALTVDEIEAALKDAFRGSEKHGKSGWQ